MAAITMNVGFVKSVPGILKIVEFVLLLLAFSCMSDCCHSGVYYTYGSVYSRVSFFLAVTVIGWLIVIALFVVFFFNLTEKVPQVNWNLANMITSIVFAVLLLICSALMAKIVDDNSAYFNRPYINSFYKRWWNTMTASVVFGFFSMIAFIIDAVFQFKGISFSRGGAANEGPGTKASNTQNA